MSSPLLQHPIECCYIQRYVDTFFRVGSTGINGYRMKMEDK